MPAAVAVVVTWIRQPLHRTVSPGGHTSRANTRRWRSVLPYAAVVIIAATLVAAPVLRGPGLPAALAAPAESAGREPAVGPGRLPQAADQQMYDEKRRDPAMPS